MAGGLTLLLGGVGSGKSALACELAARGGADVTFIATGIGSDAEMAERIAAHRAARPTAWRVEEEPLHPERALARVGEGVVVLDSIDSWVGNLMHEAGCFEPGWDPAGASGLRAEIERVLGVVVGVAGLELFVVSSEVGLGGVGVTAATRAFADLLGRANQLLAASAQRTLLVVAGRSIELQRPH